MAKTRLTLQCLLEETLGSSNVYYSPPSGLNMKYPCIKYNLVNADVDSADNLPFIIRKRYTLIYISADPDSVIVESLLQLPYCSFDRTYTSNNLTHFVFTIYW